MILNGFAIAVVWTAAIDGTGIIEWLKRKLYFFIYTEESVYEYYTLKPIDCPACMSTWTVIALDAFIYTFTFQTIIAAAVAYLVAVLIQKLINL